MKWRADDNLFVQSWITLRCIDCPVPPLHLHVIVTYIADEEKKATGIKSLEWRKKWSVENTIFRSTL